MRMRTLNALRERAGRRDVPHFDARPFAAAEIEALLDRAASERGGAGEVDALAIDLAAVAADDLGEGGREGPFDLRTHRRIPPKGGFPAALRAVDREFGDQYLAGGGEEQWPLPLAVLENGGTARSSVIVAGAMREDFFSDLMWLM